MTREARQIVEARAVAELTGAGRPTLVIHPGALGDVLLAVPALRALRDDHASARRPAAPLVLAAQPKIGRLLRALGEVDDALDFESLGLGGLFAPDGAPPPEAVLGAGRVVSWFGAGDPAYAGRLAAAAPGAPAGPRGRRADGLTIVARPWGGPLAWRHLARSVGAAGDRVEPIAVPAALVASGRAALARAREVAGLTAGCDGRRPVLMAQPGSGGAAKRWPAEGFARCLASVATEVAIVVHRGPADAESADALVAALGLEPTGRVACVLDGPDLPTLAGALAASSAVIGNDSGVSHLAAALGTPVCVLFAPDKLAWRPWSPTARVVEITPGAVTAGDVERVSIELAALLTVSSGALGGGDPRATCCSGASGPPPAGARARRTSRARARCAV